MSGELAETAQAVEEAGRRGGTRTPDPRIRNSLTPPDSKEDQQLTSAESGKVRQNPQPPRNQTPTQSVPEGDEE